MWVDIRLPATPEVLKDADLLVEGDSFDWLRSFECRADWFFDLITVPPPPCGTCRQPAVRIASVTCSMEPGSLPVPLCASCRTSEPTMAELADGGWTYRARVSATSDIARRLAEYATPVPDAL
jgi:hypothetical protein